MIKKSLLTLVFMALVGMITAQPLQFEYNGTVYSNGQTIICQYDSTLCEFVQHLRIRNLSDHDMDIIVERDILNTIEGATTFFCWGVCLTPDANIGRPVPVPAQTLSEEELQCHIMYDEGIVGLVSAMYYAYDANDPDRKISFRLLANNGADVAENTVSLGLPYPNPANTQVHFDFKDNSCDNLNVVVYNLLGQEVKSQLVSGNQGRVNIAVDDLQSGIYFCRFSANGEVLKTEKFIVKR